MKLTLKNGSQVEPTDIYAFNSKDKIVTITITFSGNDVTIDEVVAASIFTNYNCSEFSVETESGSVTYTGYSVDSINQNLANGNTITVILSKEVKDSIDASSISLFSKEVETNEESI